MFASELVPSPIWGSPSYNIDDEIYISPSLTVYQFGGKWHVHCLLALAGRMLLTNPIYTNAKKTIQNYNQEGCQKIGC
ncbi:hypothetical protein NT6N_06020 [Oceaniferula spumae]|uniref:Uncharacterized protein n=1 Tax=Oceaniferula spumae TaxID=2979115 RepID=A0AAT9FHU6_9BACT